MAKYNTVKLQVKKGKLTGLDQKYIVEKNGLKYGNVIYIYHSSKTGKVYIGQTKHFIQRNAQHYNGEEKKFLDAKFDKVLIVFSEYFDSALDDVERTLITYFNEDYTNSSRSSSNSKVLYDEEVINRNGGNSSPEYRDREKVQTEVVLPLWEKDLVSLNWVHTDKLKVLRTKALVKYSPIKNLTKQQAKLINEIIDNPKKSFVINGDAGTGKTVLLTNLVAKLITEKTGDGKQKSNSVAVVVQPNWVKTAQEIFNIYGMTDKLWIGTSTQLINKFNNLEFKAQFDVIVVDEAHKLSRRYNKQQPSFNSVYKNEKFSDCKSHLEIIKELGKRIILMYDVLQAIRPANITRDQFKSLTKNFSQKYLKTQFRIRITNKKYNSEDYINGIKWLLYKDTDLLKWTNFDENFNRDVFRDKSPDAYFGYYTDQPLHNLFDWIETDRNYNHGDINRVLSGLVVEWKQSNNGKDPKKTNNGKDPKKTRFEEDDLKKRWNSRQENWINSTDADAEDQIGSVFAVQGIDLNKVGVLIGNDLKIDGKGKLYADPDCFYNVNGTYTTEEMKKKDNQKEFTLFVLNIYYVLLTRGIDGIRIGFWHNDQFEKYMQKTLEITD